MGLESATYINELIPANPDGLDSKNEGDDHIRMIKGTVVNSFPAIDSPVFSTPAELNLLSGRTSLELVGQITMWGAAAIPDGWLLCDGSVIDGTAHPALAGLYGTNLPDLRGQFVRGYDAAGAVDPDGASRTLLDTQASALGSHTHTITNGAGLNSNVNNGGVAGASSKVGTINTTNATGGVETRPINTALHFIIKHD